jgi:hypothetical protein
MLRTHERARNTVEGKMRPQPKRELVTDDLSIHASGGICPHDSRKVRDLPSRPRVGDTNSGRDIIATSGRTFAPDGWVRHGEHHHRLTALSW